jgi:hypothetical protein
MAATFALLKKEADLGRTITTMTCDGAYPAGGYPLVNAQLGLLGNPRSVQCNYTHATATSTNVADWVPSTNKVAIFESGTGVSAPLVECVAGDITTGHTVRITAYGDVIL